MLWTLCDEEQEQEAAVLEGEEKLVGAAPTFSHLGLSAHQTLSGWSWCVVASLSNGFSDETLATAICVLPMPSHRMCMSRLLAVTTV